MTPLIFDPTGEISELAYGITILSAVVYDALHNIEIQKVPDSGDFTVKVPPPTMWTKGVTILYQLGVNFRCGTIKTPIGEFGFPKGVGITVDPKYVPPPATIAMPPES